MEERKEVQSSVKDESLIEIRRDQIIRGAVKLFKEKGFHRATTREIAKAAGFSIGTLYEYIRTKEDVLFLVCDDIYNKVHDRLAVLTAEVGTIEDLKTAVQQYFYVIDEVSDEFVIMYQESKSLSKDALRYVLQKELMMVALMEKLIQSCVNSGELRVKKEEVHLTAHHIVVQGQMWAFRRWALQTDYTIENYIEVLVDQLFNGLVGEQTKKE